MEIPVSSASYSKVRCRSTRGSFNFSCIVSFGFIISILSLFFLIISYHVYKRGNFRLLTQIPTLSIYGKGHVFSLNCICREAMQLENYMTVRSKYVPRRSICGDCESRSIPKGTKRWGEIPGQEGIRVERRNRGQKSTADFKPCEISEK